MTANEKPRKKRPVQSKVLSEQQIQGLGSIFPGFDSWYREHYAVKPDAPATPTSEGKKEAHSEPK